MPQVSVIMPAYNAEKTIAVSIQSVLQQTFTDFELIVVNDGSTDDTLDVVSRFKDKRLITHSQINRGLAGAKNTGLHHAVGEYIAFLDSDDLWRQDKLMKHVRHLNRNSNIDVSYSASLIIDKNGKSLGLHQSPKLKNITPQHVIARNPVGNGSAPVIRRSAFDKIAFYAPDMGRRICYFDESFKRGQDIECWTRLALQANAKFEGLAAPLTLYRVKSHGLRANPEKQYEGWKQFIHQAKSYAPKFIRHIKPRAHGYYLRYLARRATRKRCRVTALRYMWKAFKSYPQIIIEEPKKTIITAAAALTIAAFGFSFYRKAEAAILPYLNKKV